MVYVLEPVMHDLLFCVGYIFGMGACITGFPLPVLLVKAVYIEHFEL